MSNHDGWSTDDEIKWIREIPARVPPDRRTPFLQNYIEGARKRNRWAPIDKMTVMVAAHEALYRSSAT